MAQELDDIEELIRLRIEQAISTFKEVEFQILNGFNHIAVTRIYYGMFYSLLALSYKYGFKTSKHQQLIG